MSFLATIATFGFDEIDPEVTLRLYHRLGCTRAQLYRNDAAEIDLHDARALCEEIGLAVDSMHGVFGPAYDPSSPDDGLRRFSIDAYYAEAELARSIDIGMVVVHPSPLLPAEARLDEAHRVDRFEPLQQSLYELHAIGRELDVAFLIENLPPACCFGDDPLVLAGMVRDVQSEQVRLCYDTGHAQIVGLTADQILHCADVIAYFHIHDNDGVEDSHLMPGDGVGDWAAFGAALEHSRLDLPVMLEVFYPPPKLVRLLDGPLPDSLARWLRVMV